MAENLTTNPQPAFDSSSSGKIADLLSVLEISCELAGTPDLQPLLESIARSARKVLNCEASSVFLYDRQTHELYSRVITQAKEVRFSADRGIAGEVFRTGAVSNVPDAYADPRFNPEIDRQNKFTTRSILSCPLVGWDNATLGVLQVLNKRGGPFERWDEELAKTFSAQAGVAVQRQLLLEEFAKKQRFERDLDIARKIQQGLLPRRPPAMAGYDIAGWNQPADETGGDFFDFKELASGNLSVTLADVSGHGIGPALVVAECRALLRATHVQTEELDHLASLVNLLICEDVPDDCFVTAFLGLLLKNDNRLRYLSAGHGPILFFEKSTDAVRELQAQGCPLGFAPGLPYDPPDEVRFAPGDLLAVFTDGFFEWPNAAGERFGMTRLQDSIRRHHTLPAADIIPLIHQEVRAFTDGTPQFDDLTVVVIKKL